MEFKNYNVKNLSKKTTTPTTEPRFDRYLSKDFPCAPSKLSTTKKQKNSDLAASTCDNRPISHRSVEEGGPRLLSQTTTSLRYHPK
jgi:hypothetical protein